MEKEWLLLHLLLLLGLKVRDERIDRKIESCLFPARTPTVSVAPEGRIELDPSTNELTIECEAMGVPKPKIIWLWSGGFVEDGKVVI